MPTLAKKAKAISAACVTFTITLPSLAASQRTSCLTEQAPTPPLRRRSAAVVFRSPFADPAATASQTPAHPIRSPALAAALAALAELSLPDEPRTTLNLGTIHGGTSVNSIPESATATVDFRSTSPDELLRLEVALHRATEDAVEHANALARLPRSRGPLSFAIEKIGDRPAAQLPSDSPLLETLRSVDRHLGLRTDLRLGSTDANIPIARGVPALSLGAGGEGGGAHTVSEWYSDKDRELGLRRILLLTLAIAEWAAEL